MSVLRSIEQKIGGLFEGIFSRTFKSSVQPVELARKLAKEMDEHKTISVHRVYVPDEYTIYLNPADREQFAAYETQMRSELAEYLVEHARREGYSLPARPLVLLESDEDLAVGTFGIAVSTRGDDAEAEAPPAAPPVAPPVARPAPPVPPAPATVPLAPPVASAASLGATMVFQQPPEPERPAEVASLEYPGGVYTIEERVTVIGRSSECELTVEDANVSRRHCEIRRIGDGYSLVDLDSTNGTEVNGQRIQETALMSGDVIEVGTTRITFERRLG